MTSVEKDIFKTQVADDMMMMISMLSTEKSFDENLMGRRDASNQNVKEFVDHR